MDRNYTFVQPKISFFKQQMWKYHILINIKDNYEENFYIGSIEMLFNAKSIFIQIISSISNNFSLAFGPRSNGNEKMLHIPQSSSITGTSPWDCLVSYPGHSLLGSYPSADVQLVYSTAQADWAMKWTVNFYNRKKTIL